VKGFKIDSEFCERSFNIFYAHVLNPIKGYRKTLAAKNNICVQNSKSNLNSHFYLVAFENDDNHFHTDGQ
jgi:hypothetical protein